MDDETSWGRAQVIDLASERIRRGGATLRGIELWAEQEAEESVPAAAPTDRGRVDAAPLELARVEGSQSAYTEVAARMAAYQRAVDVPDVRVILAAERAWCEAERDAARTVVRLVEGEESDHALGRAEGFDVAARRIAGLLERRTVSPTSSAASVPAWRA